jgi:hypothetical protein
MVLQYCPVIFKWKSSNGALKPAASEIQTQGCSSAQADLDLASAIVVRNQAISI